MKNVLIPTDFSRNALNAVKYATKLFQNEECTFYLLNAYTPSIGHSRFFAETMTHSVLVENEGKTSKQELEKVIAQIQTFSLNPIHYFETISSFDFLTQKVIETLQVKDIDVIISGTKGASGYKEVFLGTNTVRMIKSVKNRPIIAVPQICSFIKPTKIAFPTDFKHNFSADVLDPLISLAKNFNSEIHIFHVNETMKKDKFKESNKHTLIEYMAPIKHLVHFAPQYSSKTNVITNFLEELDINMLALVYNNHSYLQQLMREPVVTNMAYHCKIPLLILPSE
ncbi:universal stress protein [Aurantibacter crassamenti]|uniref:universal stress protein n=1 Tax=Aurantibacter crassamenti TaxID=1837375 RepID=UPI00193A1315|nr:universal stress protein [Aurantibacter crassamenti]MBM1107367.1 universal stress protein [Aurantibacter crassamenti]